MCSDLLMKKMMDNYRGGDLNDVIRASGGAVDGGGTPQPEWLQFPGNQVNYSTAQAPPEDFGDPFAHLRDPLLHDINTAPAVPGFFPEGTASANFGGFDSCNNSGDVSIIAGHGILNDEMRRPTNVFSRMLQITAGDSPALLSGENQPLTSSVGSSRGRESPGAQIPPPPNTGIRRRKGQAKKVVCIPAPAPANSRPTGEIVPSDLWAWRKYGQKPIKGSPYPRGYYRCSSSKGCLARKQVERSRTDPNMLVITYTSEHNHPWPTQRNALAGSTRSQPFKAKKGANPKEGDWRKESAASMAGEGSAAVKEEAAADRDFDSQLELEDAEEFDQGFPEEYNSNQPEDSFFADLGEIEADSLDLDSFPF